MNPNIKKQKDLSDEEIFELKRQLLLEEKEKKLLAYRLKYKLYAIEYRNYEGYIISMKERNQDPEYKTERLEYMRKNKERYNEANKRFYYENREAALEYAKSYYQANREKYLQYAKDYYQKKKLNHHQERINQ